MQEHLNIPSVSSGGGEDVQRPDKFSAGSSERQEQDDAHAGRIRRFFDALAPARDRWRNKNLGYYRLIEAQYRFLIPPGARILEIGCGTGDLLAALEPSEGVGIDISPAMIDRARQKYPHKNLVFYAGPIEEYDSGGCTFDYIVMADTIGLLRDIKAVLDRLGALCHRRTRLIISFHSRVWQPALTLAEKLRLKSPTPEVSWVTPDDVRGLMSLSGFETIRSFSCILFPKRLPLIDCLLNRFLAKFPPFRWSCLSNFVVARVPSPPFESPPIVSVVCAARNEAGHIEDIVRRTPQMGAGMELIFVEGGSRDETYARCLQAQHEHPEMDIKVHQQTGKGKGDAVRLGFSKARGEVLMILDADMTVPPEDLPQFYEALVSGKVEFVNGSRLVYPMEEKAMRFLNLCGNKFFAMVFSFLLEQPIKDTLCGTKVMIKSDYEQVAAGRSYFGSFDPFGDFDLLFGAAKLSLKMQDLPIRYRERRYGDTNIRRWRHGLLLLRMAGLAFWRLKCR